MCTERPRALKQTSNWPHSKRQTENRTPGSGSGRMSRNLPDEKLQKRKHGEGGQVLSEHQNQNVLDPTTSPSTYHSIPWLPILARLSRRAHFMPWPHPCISQLAPPHPDLAPPLNGNQGRRDTSSQGPFLSPRLSSSRFAPSCRCHGRRPSLPEALSASMSPPLLAGLHALGLLLSEFPCQLLLFQPT